MFDFQQKRKIKKIAYSRLTIFILFVLVILLGRSTYQIYKKERLSSANYNEVKKEFEDLKNRQTMLDSEITRLKTDVGMEEEIRSKFSVAKPGETVVVVVDSSSSTSTDNNPPNKSFWSKLIGWFQ